jgi:Carboxyl transferase domain/Malonate decarboxylase gamma subunit (MdcE)
MSYLSLTASQRAQAIDPKFVAKPIALPHDSLVLGTATLAGERVYVLAQDARFEGGSFGLAESDAVASWLQGVIAAPAPIIFALDSGGARMSEGLAALGGFRRMFRAATDAWLAGVPMLFVCGKTVFGGASMLASLGDHRVFFERSLYGMSGPRIVQAVAGAEDFNAEDKAFVTQIMGGAARARREGNALVADDAAAVREFCLQWVLNAAQTLRAGKAANTLARLQAELIAQRQQLERDGLARTANSQLIPAAQFSPISVRNAWVDDGILIGRTTDDGFLYGIVNGKWADSWDAWKLANALLAQAETTPLAPTKIVLDCPAHATSRALESGMISQYFTLLGLVVRYLHLQNKNVELHIVGAAAGGVHVALAGGATRVIAHASADIRILPRIAISQVRAEIVEEKPDSNAWIRTEVADCILS